MQWSLSPTIAAAAVHELHLSRCYASVEDVREWVPVLSDLSQDLTQVGLRVIQSIIKPPRLRCLYCRYKHAVVLLLPLTQALFRKQS